MTKKDLKTLESLLAAASHTADNKTMKAGKKLYNEYLNKYKDRITYQKQYRENEKKIYCRR